MPVVTVDFHNTLVECDEWFELEVRSLVSAVLEWSDQHFGRLPSPVGRQIIDAEYRKLRLAIHAHGHELDAERSVAVVLDRVGMHLPDSIVAEAVKSLMHDALVHAKPVAGAKQFLHELRDQGMRLAVVSSAVYHPFLEWALESLSMRAELAVVVTSASSGFYKSRPEIYWAALEKLGVDRSEGTHIGDSLRFDVGGAAMAGMRTVWFDRNGSSSPADSALQSVPDLIVTNLEEAAAPISGLAFSASESGPSEL